MAALRRAIGGALRDRTRAKACAATGRVLDLGGWIDSDSDYQTSDVVVVDSPTALSDLAGEQFDSIVSIIRTPLVPELQPWLADLRALLSASGQLLMIEPVGRAGVTGRMLTITSRMWSKGTGLHYDRDLPAELRSAGLSVPAIDRFDVLSLAAPMRPFVDLRARLSPLVSSPE